MSSSGSDISSDDAPLDMSGPEQCSRLVGQDVVNKCGSECHDPSFDMSLVIQLIKLMGVKVASCPELALRDRFGASPREAHRAVRLLLHCFRLLHLCGYPREDIEVVVAQASSYLQSIAAGMEREGQPEMGLTETAHIVCVLIYVAHAYSEDQTCPLHVWHAHLFRRYCTMQTLNTAVVGLLERLQFRLRVEQEEMLERLAFLRGCDQAPKFSCSKCA